MATIKTAGIIIIGDEILSGKVQDANSVFLGKELWDRGITVCRISVIPDLAGVVAREVKGFSETYDYVLTSGGIGPTHDDVTIEGISQAFGVNPVINETLKGILEKRYSSLTGAQLKMAEVPEGAELLGCGELAFPLIKFANVFIFPGVPEFLKKKFYAVEKHFRGPRIFLRKIYFNEAESVLAPYLSEVVGQYSSVKVGSYPVLDKDYSVMVTLESTDEERLDSAVRFLLGRVPQEKTLRRKDSPLISGEL